MFNEPITINHLRPWSFSRIQKAKRCQYDFYFTYVKKLKPAQKADFFVIGSGVHFVLENALNFIVNKGQMVNRDKLYEFACNFSDTEPLADIKDIEPFIPSIMRFVNGQLRRLPRVSFAKSELALSIDDKFRPVDSFNSSDVFLRGKLDFVFGEGDTLYIVDHKTNRNSDFSNRMKTQLRCYAMLAKARFPQFKKFILELHNVRYGSIRRFVFTDNDLKGFELKFLSIVSSLEDELLGKTFDDLVASRSSNCKWCDYRDVCPLCKTNVKVKSRV